MATTTTRLLWNASWAAGLTCLASLVASAQDVQGTLRICRPARYISGSDKQPITVPAGARFAVTTLPNGDPRPDGGYNIATLVDVTIGAKPACATVAARVVYNPRQRRINQQYPLIPQFVPQGHAVLEATIAAGFQ